MSVIKPALQHPERIAYFAGANNYCWIHFRDGEKKLLAKPISYLESQLPDFIRVHKTVLLNPAYVKSLDHPPRNKMAGKVHLDSGEVFPVSRRRWPQVIKSFSCLPDNTFAEETDYSLYAPDSPQAVQPSDLLAFSIFFITDEKEKALMTKEIIREKWSACQVYTNQQSTHLPELLKTLPEQEYPTLILMDARTKTMERLYTLRHLKEDSHLSRIPVILLVSPTDQLIIDGYQHQANSVISMPTEYRFFKQMIERICQFWLHIVTLPGMGQ
ncbi:response regulator transcription factor [Spirosoma endophyticum]|uniref:Two component transcriptional regulator, LytTR family n=1 Tax=Spirosoma endophyticum TaxID=662367 RepID=A0A1I1MSG1_9BACT|nr:LytTR family transcriptional regulator DNA-binding domain-containing protein [Spirosoma endophyticum]SFC88095.1 two component transcriptional regulator, LytTR family [Spirosoma endophyticum]